MLRRWFRKKDAETEADADRAEDDVDDTEATEIAGWSARDEVSEEVSEEAVEGDAVGAAADGDRDAEVDVASDAAVEEEDEADSSAPAAQAPDDPPLEDAPATEPGRMARLREGLRKSRGALAAGIGNLLLGEKEIDESVLEDLETQLLLADVGMEATLEIVEQLTERANRRELNNSDALVRALGEALSEQLSDTTPFEVPAAPRPWVVLVVGVNGVGKTTTIGKLAHKLKAQGLVPMLAAGDTFRAAAVQQLQQWGERNDVEVIAQGEGADSASVIFDALTAARSRGADVVLADTAGRLHNKSNLMDELAKVGRVMKRFDEAAPHAVLLVLDAATGQNALAQAREFSQAVNVTGLVLTKLDGTAKGGIVFALNRQTGLPIQFIGIGEDVDDLRPFDANDFVRALLAQD